MKLSIGTLTVFAAVSLIVAVPFSSNDASVDTISTGPLSRPTSNGRPLMKARHVDNDSPASGPTATSRQHRKLWRIKRQNNGTVEDSVASPTSTSKSGLAGHRKAWWNKRQDNGTDSVDAVTSPGVLTSSGNQVANSVATPTGTPGHGKPGFMKAWRRPGFDGWAAAAYMEHEDLSGGASRSALNSGGGGVTSPTVSVGGGGVTSPTASYSNASPTTSGPTATTSGTY